MSEEPMRVFIIRRSDGVEVEDLPSWKDRYNTGDVYWWTEGNMGCDCNRWLQHERGLGNEPDVDDAKCGRTVYRVRLETPDGDVLLEDP